MPDQQLLRPGLVHRDRLPEQLFRTAGFPEQNGMGHATSLVQPNGSGARRSWIANNDSRNLLATTSTWRGWYSWPLLSANTAIGATMAAVPQAKTSVQRPPCRSVSRSSMPMRLSCTL